MNLILAAALTTSALSQTGELSNSQAPVFHSQDIQQRYIVLFEQSSNSLTNLTASNLSQTQGKPALQLPTELIQSVGGHTLHALPSVTGAVALLSNAERQQLLKDARIKLIEPDQMRYISGSIHTTYGVKMIQAPEIEDSFSSNQKVCVIDTGYDRSHEDLPSGANITGEVSNTLTTEVDLGEWYQDTYGHGTHIAGTIAALSNGIGIEGILPSGLVNLHNVKVIHNSNYWQMWASDMIAGLAACESAGATVVNMSIAGTKYSQAEEQAMQNAYDNGMILVAAAGNYGSSSYFYPASYDSVISVGAIDETKRAWMFTQDNDQVELVAPGVGIKSTIPNNQYRYWDGTSVATPHVAGAAALIWSHFPECENWQIRNILKETAQDLGDAGYDNLYGFGLVQAKTALDKIQNEGCAAGGKAPRDVIEYVSGPANLQSCGQGCFDLWLGTIADNYLSGVCSIFEETITVRVTDPKSITSAHINYAKWDDYMQIWFDNDKVWSGPNANFPPETAGLCELGTNWELNPNVEVGKQFANVVQDQEITFKIRVSVTGGGEGYASIRIYYNP